MTYSTAEVSRVLGVTLRMAQWVDECGVIPVQHVGHQRVWSREDCMCLGVLRRLARGRDQYKSWYRGDVFSLVAATRRALKDVRNRYLVFFGEQCVACQSKDDVERAYVKAKTGGVLVDLWDIEQRLARGGKREAA